MMRAVLFALVLVVAPGLGHAQDIRNFLKVNTEFCTGGQPTDEQLTRLKADGIKSVLNLRVPSEHDANAEIVKLQQLGIKYFNIPVAGSAPKDEQVDVFLKLTDDPKNRPMFIHCASANRVGGLWLIRRVLRDGWKMADAVAEAKKIGLSEGSPLQEYAAKYVERRQAGK